MQHINPGPEHVQMTSALRQCDRIVTSHAASIALARKSAQCPFLPGRTSINLQRPPQQQVEAPGWAWQNTPALTGIER
eukprot:1158306-Pelagomonas_calceolata.AAC.12